VAETTTGEQIEVWKEELARAMAGQQWRPFVETRSRTCSPASAVRLATRRFFEKPLTGGIKQVECGYILQKERRWNAKS
jgi:hypothetical protein